MGISGALENAAMKVLEMEGVSLLRSQGADYQLDIVKFTAQRGEKTAIVGPSGCGKSTALDIAGMILKPAAADRFVINTENKNWDVAQLWARNRLSELTSLRRLHMGYVLQTGELFSFLSVRENIELAALVGGLTAQEAAARASKLMAELNIGHLEKKKPAMLSIGERQRTAIARALATSPEIILADEPTAALDPDMARKVMRLFIDTASEYGSAIIMVTHDLQLATEFDFRKASIVTRAEGNGIIAELDEDRKTIQ